MKTITRRKLNAFRQKCLRKIFSITHRDHIHITNNEVLYRSSSSRLHAEYYHRTTSSFHGPHTKVIRAEIGQTCNELGSVQRHRKTRQTNEHTTLYIQGGSQEHEPVMWLCTDHCTGEKNTENSCCPMSGNALQDQSLSKSVLAAWRIRGKMIRTAPCCVVCVPHLYA